MALDLHDKIDSLFAEWSEVVDPSDALGELLQDKDNSRALFHSLRRQLRAIRKRSQKPEDGQVNIYDSALLRLYDHGHSMQHYGLFEFYMAEFLGTKRCKTDGEIKAVLAAQLAAQRILEEGKLTRKHHPTSIDVPSNITNQARLTEFPLFRTPIPFKRKRNPATAIKTNRADDYDVLKMDDSHYKQTENVRFLRDTAENLLRFLQHEDKDHPLIEELLDTVRSSQARATKLAGGRKRKFEYERSDYRDGYSPSPSPYRPSGYYGEYNDGWERERYVDRYVPQTSRGRAPDIYRP
ncbi:unnamed protein product [Penicillium olsonii]|nr:unnamed protein product [Penicillium olsonii]